MAGQDPKPFRACAPGSSRWFWTTALAVSLTLVLAGSYASSGEAKPPARSQTLRIGVTTFQPRSLHPFHVLERELQQDVPTNPIFYDALVSFGPSYEIRPLLATSWRREDASTYILTLREGVTFHDGSAFAAEDVVYTFERLLSQGSTPSPVAGCVASYVATVKSVDGAVSFQLRAPLDQESFLALIELVPIVPRGGLDEDGDTSAEKFVPVGTGPYRFVSWTDQEIQAEANPGYALGAPKIKHLSYRIFENRASMVNALHLGTLDLASRLPANEFESLRQTRDVNAYAWQLAQSSNGLQLNTQHPAFRDPRVRRAISHAVDRRLLVEHVLHQQAQPAESIVSPNLWFHHHGLRHFAYDPHKARSLLQWSGWRDTNADAVVDRNGVALRFELLFDKNIPHQELIAHYLQVQLHDVGIAVNILPTNHLAMLELTRSSKRWAAYLGSWTSSMAPAPILYALRYRTPTIQGPTWNWSNFSQPTVDQLIDDALAAPDRDTALPLLKRIMEWITEEQPSIQLYRRFWLEAASTRLFGIPEQPPAWLAPTRNRASRELHTWSLKP